MNALRKLWNWLTALWGKWNTLTEQEDRFDVYAPRERLIYSYFDGEKQVKADPLELYRRYADVGAHISDWQLKASSPMKGNVEAHDKMCELIRGIFSVKSFSEGGLTREELVGVLDHFLGYSILVKKNVASPTTSALAPSPNAENSTVVSPPTPSPSASGSSANDSTIVKPEPSASGPVSPSA